MITDFLFDGFRFALAGASEPAIAHEARYAIVGASIARGFAGIDESTLDVGYQLSYWVQMATVFAFLVLLPVGEHFHIVTALPALFFGKRPSSNRVPTVDLDRVMIGIGVGLPVPNCEPRECRVQVVCGHRHWSFRLPSQ